MNQGSGHQRVGPSSTASTKSGQSGQAVGIGIRPASPIQSQQQSFSQGEHQSLRRSNSPMSTSSTPSSPERRSGGLGEASFRTGAYQQYSAESGFAEGRAAEASRGVNDASFGSFGSGGRRPGRYRKQVIRLPDQPAGQTRQVRRRLPTPEPDTLERIYLQRTGGEVVEEITEIPTTPPPVVRERTVVEPGEAQKVIKRVIRVPPRGGAHGAFQQQQQAGTNFSGGFGAIGAGVSNFGPLGGGQQQQSTFYSAGTSGPGFGGYQQHQQQQQQQQPISFGVGGSYQQQQQQQQPISFGGGGGGYQQLPSHISFTVGGDGYSSQVMPGIGCQPAFCFYV